MVELDQVEYGGTIEAHNAFFFVDLLDGQPVVYPAARSDDLHITQVVPALNVLARKDKAPDLLFPCFVGDGDVWQSFDLKFTGFWQTRSGSTLAIDKELAEAPLTVLRFRNV